MARALDPLEADGGAAFELFHHATTAHGMPLTLLGAFSGQGLGAGAAAAVTHVVAGAPRGGGGGAAGAAAPPPPPPPPGAAPPDVAVHVRAAPGDHFAQAVFAGGRVVGALLLGDTGLDETLENLALNRLPCVGADGALLNILDADVDVDDFFD